METIGAISGVFRDYFRIADSYTCTVDLKYHPTPRSFVVVFVDYWSGVEGYEFAAYDYLNRKFECARILKRDCFTKLHAEK